MWLDYGVDWEPVYPDLYDLHIEANMVPLMDGFFGFRLIDDQ